MFERNLHCDGHTRRFLIEAKGVDGWEVREEQDSAVVRAKLYDDWHRVERARLVSRRRSDADRTGLKQPARAGGLTGRYSTNR